MTAHRALLKAGHAHLAEGELREVLQFVIAWLVELDDTTEDQGEVLGRQGEALANLLNQIHQPRTAKTSIDTDERNPITMTTQIHDNDNTRHISAVPGSYQDALGAPITPDPTGLTPTWVSSNTAVATVDPATGAIAPVMPLTPGATTDLTGTATNADGSTVAYQKQTVEIIAGPPATAATQIA